jgi:Protein of unknown function (DUF742)
MSRRTDNRNARLGLRFSPTTPLHSADADSMARPFLGRMDPSNRGYVNTDLDDDTVRAFMITGGRAIAGNGWLNFETMLEACDVLELHRHDLRFEPAKIADLCMAETLSVAEVAARLSLPIGVIQVLARDLVDEGLLYAHEPDADLATNVVLLRRLIHGIRTL